MSAEGEVVLSALVPVHPHPLLVPEQNEGWGRLRKAFTELSERIEESGADLLIVYSTTWPSIIGHQLISDPNPEWVLVDQDFHDLGSMPYSFDIDTDFAAAWHRANEARGLTSRCINYNGFPIDVGSVVALSLLNEGNRIPAAIVSSNVYANRSETIVLSKACQDAIKATGRKAAVVCAMSLSNRMFTQIIEPEDDKIHSLKDDEWNRKILEFLDDGRLEDVAQLSRQIHSQIRISKVVSFKPMWFLSGVNGQTNNLEGEVLAYEALHGAGGAVVHLSPSASSSGDKEYDEDDVEYYHGDRSVLDASTEADSEDESDADIAEDVAGKAGSKDADPGPSLWDATTGEGTVNASAAPKPVGAYPHARKVGDLLYLSGVGPRQAGSNEIPGGPIRDSDGYATNYDIQAQTRACIENVKTILEEAGSSLQSVQDVTVFLVDMDRDFEGYNEIYAEYFSEIGPTRTTLAVRALPTPIAVEMKVIALP